VPCPSQPPAAGFEINLAEERRFGFAHVRESVEHDAGRAIPAGGLSRVPVLVVGSPDDKVVPRRSLQKVARRYGGAPLLFPGMGHDMMLDSRWREPADAILDWLDTVRTGEPFLGFKRVELENTAQDYDDKLRAERVRP